MKLHIYEALVSYKKKRAARFHMPGHKANRRLFSPFRDAALDVTELSFSDSLESPAGVIADAQEDIAAILGAQRSYILTDGATAGIFAMLYAVRRRGGKVAVARSSHKSVYNACALLGVEPYILQNNARDGVLLPPGAADVEAALSRDAKIGAVLLTSPDYYGNTADFAAVRKVCDRFGKPLFVDGAHGAYLKFDPDMSGEYAGNFASAWVDGSHKTMPTLTQGALLSASDEALVPALEEGLDVFRTTSPSYPIMAAVEYGVKFLAERGAELIDSVRRELALAKARLAKRGISCYGGSKTLVFAVDFGALGISPSVAYEELERRGVFAELCDGRYVLFYLSPLTAPAQIARMERAVRAVARTRSLRGSYEAPHELPLPGARKFSFLAARGMPYEELPPMQAVGRVCARNAGVSPPCYPVAVAGEQLTEEGAAALAAAKHTFGMREGKVAVLNIGGRAGNGR